MYGMLEILRWGQFRQWLTYSQIEPFGEERADYRSAMVVAALHNIYRDTKKYPKPFPISDFMPFKDSDSSAPETSERKPLTDTSSWQKIKLMAMALADQKETLKTRRPSKARKRSAP